jgi:Importin-beta N-terminal domain
MNGVWFQPEFVRQLATVLANTTNVPYVRQASGLQLKNTLAAKDTATNEECKKR